MNIHPLEAGAPIVISSYKASLAALRFYGNLLYCIDIVAIGNKYDDDVLEPCYRYLFAQ